MSRAEAGAARTSAVTASSTPSCAFHAPPALLLVVRAGAPVLPAAGEGSRLLLRDSADGAGGVPPTSAIAPRPKLGFKPVPVGEPALDGTAEGRVEGRADGSAEGRASGLSEMATRSRYSPRSCSSERSGTTAVPTALADACGRARADGNSSKVARTASAARWMGARGSTAHLADRRPRVGHAAEHEERECTHARLAKGARVWRVGEPLGERAERLLPHDRPVDCRSTRAGESERARLLLGASSRHEQQARECMCAVETSIFVNLHPIQLA
eukprot:scaffold168214_cov25-Tisochrysis_lutea.AAC.1